jgi:hypothetical protein
MVKLYASLWHVSHEEMTASEGVSGYHCESAETEKSTYEEAKKVLKAWLSQQQKSCTDTDCEHTPIITDELRPKMIMAGMTANMVKIS